MAQVLLIDDDPLVRETVTVMLVAGGHRVTATEDGRAGLEAFHQGSFEAAVVDILMPEKEGIETVQELRHFSPGLAIVAISGGPAIRFDGQSGDLDFLRMARSLGADATLRKPFTRRALLEALEAALAQGRPRSGA